MPTPDSWSAVKPVAPGGTSALDALLGGSRWALREAGVEEAGFHALAERMLITPPEDCVGAILDGLRRGRKRIVTGNGSRTMSWLPRLFPNSYDTLMKRLGLCPPLHNGPQKFARTVTPKERGSCRKLW